MPKIQDQRSKDNQNPLYCHGCDEYKFIESSEYPTAKYGKKVWIKNFKYCCKSCGSTEASSLKNYIDHPFFSNDRFIEGSDGFLRLGEPDRVKNYSSLGLKYDWMDYYGIPGLTRVQDDGSLTPVYFKKELLLFFNYNPNYKVKMFGWSVASIFKKQDSGWEKLADWGIGVNRYGNLYVFLGDLYDYLSDQSISEEEMRIWQTQNIESDHDIVSDLYFQQIECCYTLPDNERRIFQQILELNELTQTAYGFDLFNFDFNVVEESYQHAILNEKHQVARSVNLLTQYIVEGINKDGIKGFLEQKPISFEPSSGSNKLFSKFISTLSDQNLTNGLFVLYDLEIVLGHRKSERGHQEILKSIVERLNIDFTTDHLELFQKIISEIISNFDELIVLLKDINQME